MADQKDTAVFSPMLEKASPNPSDEVQIDAAPPVAEEAAPAPAAEARPEGEPESTPEPVATDWERRAKDTQRALSERERALNEARIELEVIKRTMGANSQPAVDAKAEIEKLEEDVRNDPARAVQYVHQLLAMRDDHYQRELMGLRSEFERRAMERDPEFKAVRESLEKVKDIPAFANLPLEAQIEVAKRMRAQAQPAQQMRPPGGVGGQRQIPPKKPETAEERFAPFLRASGAIKSNAPRGVVQFQFGQ